MSTATKISKDEIKEAIKNMTMIEVAELVKELEEEFGVSAAAPVAVAAAAPADGGPAAAEEQTDFSVILVSPGGNKIPVIKEVRAITGLGLKEAKEAVEAGGKPIKENLPKEEAEKIKKQLEDVGATVEIK
jgi:large subunit ribosomal protein L7/L12